MNSDKESIMSAGRNALFGSLIISGIVTYFLTAIFLIVFNTTIGIDLLSVPLLINAIICYPLYRYLVGKHLRQ